MASSTGESAPSRAADEQGTTSAISNEMVRLHKSFFGRGPTRTRTHWCGDDVILVVLEDTLAPAERNLVEMGEHERLRETRMFLKYATVREFCQAIESITGRKVRAFISGIDTKVGGVSTETFLMHPAGYDGPSRIELDSDARPPRT